MDLTIKEYAEKRGIGKGYIHRLVQNGSLHLLKDVKAIQKKKDKFGTEYYILKMRPVKGN